MTLRYTVVHLALDIEHHAKLQLMREAEAHNEDGYAIIKDYFSTRNIDVFVFVSESSCDSEEFSDYDF